jgi:ATP-binding cassette subfamily B protein
VSSQEETDSLPPKFDVALWKKVLAFGRPHLGKVIGLMVVAVAVAGFDTGIPYFNGRIVDDVKSGVSPARNFVLYGGMFVCFATSIWGFIMLAGRISVGVSYDIRKTAFAHLQALSFSFYDKKAVGWLMARLTSDVGNLSRVMGWALLDLTWGSTVILFIVAAMVRANWRLGLLFLVLVVPGLALISAYFQKRLLLTSRALRKANSLATGAFNEGLTGLRTTRSMNREERNLEEFTVLADEMYAHAMRNALLSAAFVPLLTSVCFTGVAIGLWKGGIDVTRGTGFTLGGLVSFIQYATFIQFPVQQLAQTITNVRGAQASAERLQGLLDTQPEIADRPDSRELAGTIESITFENVSFGYLPGQLVLRDFNLTIRQGQSVALVGPTGGGKSTIVSLACRFYEPTSGRVLINGVDYRELKLGWLQSRLGMVLQQPHLFSGTIRENIRYGRLAATDGEVERAAQLAGAEEFIRSFKDGFETKVGEGGNRLSTGQKQLISLARAIVAEPQVFVMDEATSSVDTSTERAIQSAVERILRGRISFVIAHRLSTIKRADLILVISGGVVIEQGSHHDLLALKGKYFELYTNQFTAEHEDELLHVGDAQSEASGDSVGAVG